MNFLVSSLVFTMVVQRSKNFYGRLIISRNRFSKLFKKQTNWTSGGSLRETKWIKYPCTCWSIYKQLNMLTINIDTATKTRKCNHHSNSYNNRTTQYSSCVCSVIDQQKSSKTSERSMWILTISVTMNYIMFKYYIKADFHMLYVTWIRNLRR